MTELLSRPILRVKPVEEAPCRSVVLSAAIAAGWTLAASLVACIATAVAGWFAADTGSFSGAIRVGALGWLVGNGGGLHLKSGAVTVIPLGLVAVVAWMLHRGGRWAAEHSQVRSSGGVAAGTLVMMAVYAGAGLVVFFLTRSDAVHADLLRTVVGTTTLPLVFGGLGLARGAGHGERVLDALPEEAQAALTGGLGGILAMVCAGGVLVTVSLLVHFSAAVSVAEALDSGVVGGTVMALIGAAMVPNAILCAGAFIAGPGFAVGSGTLIAPGAVTLGPLPAFPLLAALPTSGATGGWHSALIVVPVIAGGLAGLVAVRRYPVFGLDQVALRGALAGLAGGLGFGALTWLATGAIGPGRMQEVGPDVPATILVFALACLVGGAVAAMGDRWVREAGRQRKLKGARESE
ncbi:MAG: hypothetical protein H0U28_03110 [Nocardioidaceae bacterium]|nr:hypothetical protein [Nocardioidaceae bacterium]